MEAGSGRQVHLFLNVGCPGFVSATWVVSIHADGRYVKSTYILLGCTLQTRSSYGSSGRLYVHIGSSVRKRRYCFPRLSHVTVECRHRVVLTQYR
jgi:hypothetical protein